MRRHSRVRAERPCAGLGASDTVTADKGADVRVRELMTTDPVTTTADTSLKEAARLMLTHRISGLPVVDAAGTLIGIVTEGDIVHQESRKARGDVPGLLRSLFCDDGAPAITAGEAMTSPVITTGPDIDHTVAAKLMETKSVEPLPVVDADGRVIGIVGRSDIMASFARPDELIQDEIQVDILDRIIWTEPGAVTVKVIEGRVTLSGSVPKKTDARILWVLTRRLDGVVDVNVDEVRYPYDDTKAAQSAGGPIGLW